MEGTEVKKSFVVGVAGVAVAALLALTGCSSVDNGIGAAMRALGASPGTIYNFGTDGQLVYQAHCASMDFEPDHEFDVYSVGGDGKTTKVSDSSVVQISCGHSLIKTVGFSTVYVSDSAQAALIANSQQFSQIKIQNNDRNIPLVNFAWRAVKNKFVGTSAVVQISDQWNNPVMAFAGSINGFASDVAKSTMFQLKFGPNERNIGWIWASRVSYTQTDTALLN
jgi:hypothetical protein